MSSADSSRVGEGSACSMEVCQLSGVSEVQRFGALGGAKPGQTDEIPLTEIDGGNMFSRTGSSGQYPGGNQCRRLFKEKTRP